MLVLMITPEDDETEGQREAEMPTRQDEVGLGRGLRNVKCYQTSTWPRQGAGGGRGLH